MKKTNCFIKAYMKTLKLLSYRLKNVINGKELDLKNAKNMYTIEQDKIDYNQYVKSVRSFINTPEDKVTARTLEALYQGSLKHGDPELNGEIQKLIEKFNAANKKFLSR